MGSPLAPVLANIFMVFTNVSGLMNITLTNLNFIYDILMTFWLLLAMSKIH